jgi:hypothetical protein
LIIKRLRRLKNGNPSSHANRCAAVGPHLIAAIWRSRLCNRKCNRASRYARIQQQGCGAKTLPELEQVVNGAIGPSGFMEFMRINHGQFLDKAQGEGSTRILRFIVGNPLIMMQIAIHAPDAGSHSPVTILVDQRDDGVHLSYNTMAGYLAHYGNLALTVARELDTKVEALLKSAAG